MLTLEQLNGLTYRVIGRAMNVHRVLGPGLLESAYKAPLVDDLRRAGMHVEVERPLPVVYEGRRVDCGYRIDLIVDEVLIVEAKAVQRFDPIHLAQTLTYLRLSGLPLALLSNFNARVLKSGIKRVINDRVHLPERAEAEVADTESKEIL